MALRISANTSLAESVWRKSTPRTAAPMEGWRELDFDVGVRLFFGGMRHDG